ncbi:MAG TPA: methyltransferase [Polyangia bacterium]|nr:methyltransferase [Polyangia bacterium]
MIEAETVERVLHALFIAVANTTLRREDRKKAIEVAAFLEALRPHVGKGRLLVDAAAGKAYVGILAAALLGVERLHVIERDAARADACRTAFARLPEWQSAPAATPAATTDASAETPPTSRAALHVVVGDVADRGAWPARPDVVAALHACGAASDAILDAAVAAEARWLYLVPCCYAAAVPFAPVAEAAAERLGLPRHAEVRRRFVTSLIDAERTLRLEAAGYETTVLPLVPPTVTPHNLVWRARRVREPQRMAEAATRLARLREPITSRA